MPALVQDLGRFGQTGQGVSSAGALDQGAFRQANRIVGNPVEAACLEITLGGFSFEVSGPTVMALTGAPCPLAIRDVKRSCHRGCELSASLVGNRRHGLARLCPQRRTQLPCIPRRP